eukprot:Skav233703  [mRNA]  locus=scaffold1927:425050:425262:- [translate_table: standard]
MASTSVINRCTAVLYTTWSSLVMSSTFWITSDGASSTDLKYRPPWVSLVSWYVSHAGLSQLQWSGSDPSK